MHFELPVQRQSGKWNAPSLRQEAWRNSFRQQLSHPPEESLGLRKGCLQLQKHKNTCKRRAQTRGPWVFTAANAMHDTAPRAVYVVREPFKRVSAEGRDTSCDSCRGAELHRAGGSGNHLIQSITNKQARLQVAAKSRQGGKLPPIGNKDLV